IQSPPGMCMNFKYMFMTMVIPGPSNSKHLIDVYLDSLSEELQNLWHVSVLTRDSAKNETFTMHAALMWTMNDLPAYGMASRWSTAGVIGCPVCMKDIRAFYLQNERKVARPRLTGEQIHDWVKEFSPAVEVPLSLLDGYGSKDKWTKKSIFWKLEYWSTHLI
ncbi:UNVERIFIED_CONTAM: hypothetical protein Slati_2370100, partial [Sesamum latifolium]